MSMFHDMRENTAWFECYSKLSTDLVPRRYSEVIWEVPK